MQHAWFAPQLRVLGFGGFRCFGPVGFYALVLGSVSLPKKDVIVMLPRILSCIQTPLNGASSQGAKKWRGPRERLLFIRNGFWPICVSNSSLRRWMKTEYEGDDLDLMYSSLVWFPGRCQKRCGEAPRGVNMVSIWMFFFDMGSLKMVQMKGYWGSIHLMHSSGLALPATQAKKKALMEANFLGWSEWRYVDELSCLKFPHHSNLCPTKREIAVIKII